MLIGISPLISPELLSALYRMGHGDEIVLADAHFPGEGIHPRVIRADGLAIAPLLDAILPLFALDKTDAPLIMMRPSAGDPEDPHVEQAYWHEVVKHWPGTAPIVKIDRSGFYERAKKAFAVVMTGETATYANIILKKGVTPFPA
jgi:L-fucose mutarotase